MIFSTPFISVGNTLKKIFLLGTLLSEFTSEYYNGNNDTFGLFFKNIQLVLMNFFFINSLWMNGKLTQTRQIMKISRIWVFTCLLKKSELAQSINVDHWLILILNGIEWFQFQGILEHADFHAKGDSVTSYSILKVFYIFLIIIWDYYVWNAKVICIEFKNCERNVT